MAGTGIGTPTSAVGALVSDVLTLARRYLKDAAKDYWADAVLIAHLNSAQQTLARDRPDLLLGSQGSVLNEAAYASVLADYCAFDASWANALALKTALFALMEDSADTTNASRAEEWHALYLREIGMARG